MKTKFLLIILCCVSLLTVHAQDRFLVSDFEEGDLYWNPIGTGVTVMVVNNPLADNVVNPSNKVLKITCPKNEVYGGAIISVLEGVNVGDTGNNYRYAHVKFYKPIEGTSIFKIEEGPVGAREISQTIPSGTWVEMVFDFNFSGNNDAAAIGNYKKVFIMANTSPYDSETVTIYIDDIYFSNDPTVNNGLPAPTDDMAVIDNFESGMVNFSSTLNEMENMAFQVVDNPLPGGINTSEKVLKMTRNEANTNAWAGFWAEMYSEATLKCDLDKYSYARFKILQDVSGASAHFKLEEPEVKSIEKDPVEGPTKINEWEELVFDLSEGTGIYPRIIIMPDYADNRPAHSVYIDDIVLTRERIPSSVNNVFSVINSLNVSEQGDVVTIHFVLVESAPVTITIYDMTGNVINNQTLHAQSGQNRTDFVLPTQGLYIVKVSTNGKGLVSKFVKK